MGFLASRREKSNEVNRPLTRGRRGKDKAAGTEDEISRFFSSGKQVLAERDMNRQDKRLDEAGYPHDKGHGHAMHAASRRSDRKQSPNPPIELPEKPFLGFGNRGAPPFPPIESNGPIGKTALSETPSEVTQRTPSRSITNYTWSRSGIESNSTGLKRHEGVVQPSERPIVSTASNPAVPSIETGQLCPTSNPELRLPDMHTILSPEKPRPSRSSAETTHRLRPKRAAYPPDSQPVVNATHPTEAGKVYHDNSKQHEPVENNEGVREQYAAGMKRAGTTDIGHDVDDVPTEVERKAILQNEPNMQVQYLESLLNACKTTLSGLVKIGYEPPTLRARKPPEQPVSVGSTEAPSIVHARTNDETHLSRGAAKIESEKQKTTPGKSIEDISTSPKQRAGQPSDAVGRGKEGSSKDLEDASGPEPMGCRTRQPLRSTCGVHTQQRAPCNAATAFNHRIGGLDSYALQDTRTPLAHSKVYNPHQSSRFAYVNADAQQSSGGLYAFQHSREGDSTDWLCSSRHTPLGLRRQTLPDSKYSVGDSRMRTAHGTSSTKPVQYQDVEIGAQNVQDDSLLVDTQTPSGYPRNPPWYERPTTSSTAALRGYTPRLDDFTDDTMQTDMQVDVLDEEAMYSQEVSIERNVNYLAPGSETDERPMTRFWHPHRLY